MPAEPASDDAGTQDRLTRAQDAAPLTMLLHEEVASVVKREQRTLVRAAVSTSIRNEVVDEALDRTQVIVERVPIGRIVDAVPPARVEGDVTILSVVEEELVLVRRLVLKEEVHLRTVRTTSRHTETVPLRTQDVTITRMPIED